MLIGVESVTSGVGSGNPTAAFDASWTSTYWPGATSMAGSSVMRFVAEPKFPTPYALVYCTDHPEVLAVVVPRLKISMKSCV